MYICEHLRFMQHFIPVLYWVLNYFANDHTRILNQLLVMEFVPIIKNTLFLIFFKCYSPISPYFLTACPSGK